MPSEPSSQTVAGGPWYAGLGRLGHGLFGRVRRAIRDDSGAKVSTEVLRDDNPTRFLDPATIGRFGLTPMVARRVVEGFISGLHKSPFHGFSVEFADHREYVPGDDMKYIDWMLFARTDHYYIKRYEEETNVRCHIMLDRSASMAFGTAGISKWDYACFLATCLAYLMIKQQDAVGLSLVGERPGLLVPPRCRNTHLHQLMRMMIQHPPAGGTALASGVMAMVRNLKRRSVVVLISDLIDDPEETIRAIRMIAAHGHEVIVFQVQDPAESDFSFEGSTLFRDVETGEELEVDPEAIRDSYLANMAELEQRFRRRLTEVGVDYQVVNTRQPYDHALWSYLRRRAAMRK